MIYLVLILMLGILYCFVLALIELRAFQKHIVHIGDLISGLEKTLWKMEERQITQQLLFQQTNTQPKPVNTGGNHNKRTPEQKAAASARMKAAWIKRKELKTLLDIGSQNAPSLCLSLI